jgi:hypothetical protein
MIIKTKNLANENLETHMIKPVEPFFIKYPKVTAHKKGGGRAMKGRIILIAALGLFMATGGLFAQVTLPVPTNLQAQAEPFRLPGVRLTWQVPFRYDINFKVYRSVADSTNFHAIGTTRTRMYHDLNVSAGNTYYYYVTSILFHQGTYLESQRSDIVSIAFVGTPTPKGTVSGRATDDSTGLPIPGVRIRFFRTGAFPLEILRSLMNLQTFTDSLGHYEAKLDTGKYLIKAEPMDGVFWESRYRPEWYDNAPDPASATPVHVMPDSTFTADFKLIPIIPIHYVNISGRVTDTLGAPLSSASVVFMRTIQEMNLLSSTTDLTPGLGEEEMDVEGVGHTYGILGRGRTDSLGNYQVRVISGESYIALASKLGYVPEYFNNKSNPQDADIIVVTKDTTGVDFSLSPNPVYQNSVSGLVRDSLGTGVPSRVVLFPVHHVPGIKTRFAHTDSLGAYTISNVATGNYFVLAVPFSGYAPAFYKNGAYGVRHWKDADTVAIAGNVSGIDIGVVPINSVGFVHMSGSVHSSDGMPLDGVSVVATISTGDVVGYGLTDGSGNYAIDGLTTGMITLSVDKVDYSSTVGNVSIQTSPYSIDNVDFTLSIATVTSVLPAADVPTGYSLKQNYPNPFNPSTEISFEIPVSSTVTLKIFNMIGQEVRTLVHGTLPAGTQDVTWNGTDDAGHALASGVYFYSLNAVPVTGGKTFSEVRKMVLLK